MLRRFLPLFLLLAAIPVASCGSTPKRTPCEEWDTRPCTCSDETEGFEICDAEATWGECLCGTNNPDLSVVERDMARPTLTRDLSEVPDLIPPRDITSTDHATGRTFPCPNILLVLDRSGSMDETPGGWPFGNSKWKILQNAVSTILGTKIAGTTQTYGDLLPWGLEMFTSAAASDAQCYADAQISVEPARGTAGTIIAAVNAAKPDSGTNTGEAIRRAAEDPVLRDKKRGQYIILITDGDPNCNTGDGKGDAAYTVAQIAAAAAQDPPIQTFVIGFDGSTLGGVNPGNLNKMAQAGKQPRAGCNPNGGTNNPCYYSASDPAELDAALSAIIRNVSGEFKGLACQN